MRLLTIELAPRLLSGEPDDILLMLSLSRMDGGSTPVTYVREANRLVQAQGHPTLDMTDAQHFLLDLARYDFVRIEEEA